MAMDRETFDKYCASLPATTHVVQWGNASVWKIGGKIFAICSTWGKKSSRYSADHAFSFKCSDLSYAVLIEQDGLAPAPYLARAKWVAVEKDGALSDDELKSYIAMAHKIVAGKLTKAARKKLGLHEA